MEALIILIGEFLLAPLVAGITALFQLIGMFVGLALELIFGIRRKSFPKKSQKQIPLPPGVLKWIRRVILGSLSIFTTAILLINFVLLEETLRFVADKVETNTGIEIEYEFSEGNLFTGRFSFSDLELVQSTLGKAQFHVKASRVEVDLPIFRLVSGKREIETLRLTGAQIEYETPDAPKAEKPKRSFSIGVAVTVDERGVDGATVTTRPELLNTPKYKIDHLVLENVDIQVIDHSAETPTAYDINIHSFQASPLRSHFAIFDLLFRSNLDATLEGSSLAIINTEENSIRHTRWTAQDVPAEVLASLIGGPFTLFDGGLVDVEINDQWEADQVDNLSLDWKIIVKDAHARLPESMPTALRPLAQVWVNNINKHQKDWEFGFQLELSESRFRGASSLNAKQIWEGSIPVILKQISNYTNINESVIKDTTSKTFDRFKGFL